MEKKYYIHQINATKVAQQWIKRRKKKYNRKDKMTNENKNHRTEL